MSTYHHISIYRVSLCNFLRVIAPHHTNRPGKLAHLLVGVVTYLGTNRGRYISAHEIADWVYSEDAAGGPDWSISCITATICRLRKRGVPIKHYYKWGYTIDPRVE